MSWIMSPYLVGTYYNQVTGGQFELSMTQFIKPMFGLSTTLPAELYFYYLLHQQHYPFLEQCKRPSFPRV